MIGIKHQQRNVNNKQNTLSERAPLLTVCEATRGLVPIRSSEQVPWRRAWHRSMISESHRDHRMVELINEGRGQNCIDPRALEVRPRLHQGIEGSEKLGP